jgi:hypothetical protein
MFYRHATVAPVDSNDRLSTVFLQGSGYEKKKEYRLSNTASFDEILSKFKLVQSDLETSKDFIHVNIDLGKASLASDTI